MKLGICMVLYQKPVLETETIRSMLNGEDDLSSVTLYIRDNSPASQEKAEDEITLKASFSDYMYSWDGQNRPLSSVYNEAIDHVNADLLILLDDDTRLPVEFLKVTREAASLHPDIDLFLPLVISAGRIVSPGGYRFVKGRHWQQERRGRLPARNIVAIASGMAIRASYLKGNALAFDEGLDFYGIDTRFMLDYADHRRELFVTSCTLLHDSALETETDKERILSRFRKLRKAWGRLHRRDPARHLASLGYAVLVSVKLALRYSDIRFLR